MARAYIYIAMLVVLWLLGCASGVGALILGRRDAVRWFRHSLALALIGLAIGALGFWTPIAFWPKITYTYTSGGVQRTIESSWFFAGPLLLGVIALLWVARNRWKSPRGEPPLAG